MALNGDRVVMVNAEGYEQLIFRISGGKVLFWEKHAKEEREVGRVERVGQELRFVLPLSRIE